ncbi:984_t:CDS:2 [Ambispora gerdemannii]|uniref:984_t:CDS:1 n=1 Tax=Ambispora gerdemannii TaxID=144530 RepID=A0A9N9FKF9_9GLOM|nr:984_t:CDS:2 [Ambispora gerdemannii]
MKTKASHNNNSNYKYTNRNYLDCDTIQIYWGGQQIVANACKPTSLMSQEDPVTARIVLVTCPDESVAKKLSRGLVEEKLAACVNVIHGLTSLYWWDGHIEEAAEQMLVVKTEDKHVREVTDYVNKNHGYEVPGVISIKIDKGSTKYLNWIKESVKD